MELAPLWERYAEAIDAELRSLFQDRELPFYHLMGYHLGWRDAQGQPASFPGGKRLRPTLCLLGCEAVGGDWQRALPAAAAIELIHNFSLIHDDIEDQSPQRRHRPALWTVAGTAQAINAGDGMHALAHLALFRLVERGVTPELTFGVAHLLDGTCLRLCQGQYLDIFFESAPKVTIEDYLDMAELKTASLIGASLMAGALIGGASEEVASALARFGLELGLAFQIRDDILGLWGDPQVTGKPPGGDIIQKKKSLPIVYALNQTGKKAARLRQVYSQERIVSADAPQVMEILEGLGARQWSQALAETHHRRALAELEGTEISPKGKRCLQAMAALVAEREN